MIRLHSLPYGVANLNTSFSKNEVLGLTPSGATTVFFVYFSDMLFYLTDKY